MILVEGRRRRLDFKADRGLVRFARLVGKRHEGRKQLGDIQRPCLGARELGVEAPRRRIYR